jgi:hypothetical protein
VAGRDVVVSQTERDVAVSQVESDGIVSQTERNVAASQVESDVATNQIGMRQSDWAGCELAWGGELLRDTRR